MVPILCLYGVSAHVFHAFLLLLFKICLFYPLPSLAGLLSIERERRHWVGGVGDGEVLGADGRREL